MKCVTCKHGNTQPGTTVVTIAQDGITVVIKDVPAQVCDLCGAYYLDANTVEEIRILVNSEKEVGNEISIVSLKRAA